MLRTTPWPSAFPKKLVDFGCLAVQRRVAEIKAVGIEGSHARIVEAPLLRTFAKAGIQIQGVGLVPFKFLVDTVTANKDPLHASPGGLQLRFDHRRESNALPQHYQHCVHAGLARQLRTHTA